MNPALAKPPDAIHLACIHANFRVPSCDYEVLLRVTRILTKNAADVRAAFRLMVFNILAHNRDDHVKNFAFVLSAQGDWQFAPAYDLTFAHGPGGEHTTTVSGEGRAPGLLDILKVAESAGIAQKEAREIVDEVTGAVADWAAFADLATLDSKRAREIQSALPSLG
ncbi:MAG: serine/threonine-protein kinase HipA [Rhodothermales bacterium]|jgi:serine/threonine-protein kinase HipA